LHTALCRSFNIAEARKHVEKLSIVHVHGKLGLLPWEGGESSLLVPYGKELSDSQIRVASRCINIVCERETDEQCKKAREHLQGASRVYFLGFGYSRTNLEHIATECHGASVAGTRLGMTNKEVARAGVDIEQLFEPKKKRFTEDDDCEVLLFLRKQFSFGE